MGDRAKAVKQVSIPLQDEEKPTKKKKKKKKMGGRCGEGKQADQP